MSEAEAALAAWGGGRIVRFLKDRENAVHEVVVDGVRAALRLHRPGYQSIAAIRSELWWMQALSKVGLPVPLPIKTLAGDLVQKGPRVATVIGWVEGTPLGEAGVPLAGPLQAQSTQFHKIGALVARMHNATDIFALPSNFERPAWDIEGLLGEAPVWGRFWDNPALNASEKSLVLVARDLAREQLNDFAARGGDYGLIHADVLRENVLFSGETVSIIDFDDCGFGFRMYDLATLASQNESEPEYQSLIAAAIVGYRSERALSDKDATLLPLFVMLRRFASMGWVVDRVSEGDARLRTYAEPAVRAADKWLGRPG